MGAKASTVMTRKEKYTARVVSRLIWKTEDLSDEIFDLIWSELSSENVLSCGLN
jgi:hypothetical protein